MKLLVHILILSSAVTAELYPASANDAGSAIRDFGLVGTWSSDCSKDIKKEITQRTTFIVPSFGKPTMEVALHVTYGNLDNLSTRIDEIQSATRIAEDKLEYVSLTIKREDSSPAVAKFNSVAKPYRVLIQKKGTHTRILESGAEDQPPLVKNGIVLSTGLPTHEFERCPE